MSRDWYANNVYGTQTTSVKESLLVVAFKTLWGVLVNFSFWLFLSLGVWNSLLVPTLGATQLSLANGAVLLAGLFLGRAIFGLKS